jgi:hypothetical protein
MTTLNIVNIVPTNEDHVGMDDNTNVNVHGIAAPSKHPEDHHESKQNAQQPSKLPSWKYDVGIVKLMNDFRWRLQIVSSQLTIC